MPEDFPPFMVPAAIAAMLLLLEGVSLTGPLAAVHTLGIPVRRGSGTYIGVDPLPCELRGAIAAHIGEDRVAYWSGWLRFGFRGAHFSRMFRGMGIMCSGTLIVMDGTAVWKERLRLSPLLLTLALIFGTMGMFNTIPDPDPAALPLITLGPVLLFGALYTVAALISLYQLRGVRRRLVSDG